MGSCSCSKSKTDYRSKLLRLKIKCKLTVFRALRSISKICSWLKVNRILCKRLKLFLIGSLSWTCQNFHLLKLKTGSIPYMSRIWPFRAPRRFLEKQLKLKMKSNLLLALLVRLHIYQSMDIVKQQLFGLNKLTVPRTRIFIRAKSILKLKSAIKSWATHIWMHKWSMWSLRNQLKTSRKWKLNKATLHTTRCPTRIWI